MTETLGILGIGAFGEFILPHLAPHFKTRIFDTGKDVRALARHYRVEATDLAGICAADAILLATPVRSFETLAQTMAPMLREGQLVMDVGSVKLLPSRVLQQHLPPGIDIVGLHPLFGPQSGKFGIEGLNVAVCNVRGGQLAKVVTFLREKLGLHVIETTPEQHDRELAYVQGLTHLIGKVFVSLELPEFAQTTKTYDLLRQMVEMVRFDSDELFRTIERDNPFTAEAKTRFFAAVAELEKKLGS